MNVYIVCTICFVLGYVLGRLDGLLRPLRGLSPGHEMVQTTSYERMDREVQGNFSAVRKKRVEIDDSKFVTDVSTEGMISAGTSDLGTVTETEDTIGSAANKLAALKRRKG